MGNAHVSSGQGMDTRTYEDTIVDIEFMGREGCGRVYDGDSLVTQLEGILYPPAGWQRSGCPTYLTYFEIR